MKNIITSLKKYLIEVLGIEPEIKENLSPKGLPFYLLDLYKFYTIQLLNQKFLLIRNIDKSEKLTPAKIEKQINLIKEKLNIEVIYLIEALENFNRKRLIEYKIPFIVPNNQLYIPDLKLDLREHFIQIRNPKERLGPASQAVFLWLLNNKTYEKISLSKIAKKLNYSNMTLTRVINELLSKRLICVEAEGREKLVKPVIEFKSDWKEILKELQTPVKQKVYIKNITDEVRKKLVKAGLTDFFLTSSVMK